MFIASLLSSFSPPPLFPITTTTRNLTLPLPTPPTTTQTTNNPPPQLPPNPSKLLHQIRHHHILNQIPHVSLHPANRADWFLCAGVFTSLVESGLEAEGAEGVTALFGGDGGC